MINDTNQNNKIKELEAKIFDLKHSSCSYLLWSDWIDQLEKELSVLKKNAKKTKTII